MSGLDELMGRVEEVHLPEGAVAALRRVAGSVRSSPVGGDILSGRRIRHPAHPALVVLPLGSWSAALLLDLLGGRSSRRAARRLTGIGVLGAAPAVLAGLDDWLDTTGPEQQVGALHAAANLAAAGGWALSWRLRKRHHAAGVLAGLAATTAAATGGWLGGHLTYAMGVGVDTNAFSAGPSTWTAYPAPVEAGTMSAATVAGATLAATRLADGPAVLSGRCSHRGGPLGDGEVSDGCVTCPWHGSRFDLRSGQVRRGPAVRPQPVYETRDVDGAVDVRRAEPRSMRTNPV